MRFSVSHETLYRYSVPVSLAPHLLRLDPRLDGGRLLSRELFVEPAPVLRIEEFDAHGNALTRVEFGAPTAELRVDSRFVIDTVAPTPHSASAMAPLPWAFPLGDGLDAYRGQPWCDPPWPSLPRRWRHRRETRRWFSWNCSIAHCINASTTASGSRRGQSAGHTFVERPRSVPRHRHVVHRRVSLPAAGSLRERLSCAAAFAPTGAGDLHAWAEVGLPGIGWQGWDPSNGIPAGEGHVALCATPDQAASMPVEGGGFANGVTVTLDYCACSSAPAEAPARNLTGCRVPVGWTDQPPGAPEHGHPGTFHCRKLQRHAGSEPHRIHRLWPRGARPAAVLPRPTRPPRGESGHRLRQDRYRGPAGASPPPSRSAFDPDHRGDPRGCDGIPRVGRAACQRP